MLRLRSGLGSYLDDYLPNTGEAVRKASNIQILQGALGLEKTGVVDAATVAAVNKKLGTTHSASYITDNAVLLADKVGQANEWPVWKLALVGGGVLAAVFVVVKLARGH